MVMKGVRERPGWNNCIAHRAKSFYHSNFVSSCLSGVTSERAVMFGAYAFPSIEAHTESKQYQEAWLRKLSDAGQTQWRMRLDINRRYLTGSLHDNKHASAYTRRKLIISGTLVQKTLRCWAFPVAHAFRHPSLKSSCESRETCLSDEAALKSSCEFSLSARIGGANRNWVQMQTWLKFLEVVLH